MYCRAATGGLLAAIILTGCARQSRQSGPERIAILRFENLSGDTSVDWLGRALSEVVAYEVTAIPSARLQAFNRAMGARPVSAPGISTENPLALAAGATRIGYGEYTVRNGRLEARLTLEDPRTLKMVRVVETTAPAGDVLAAGNALARQISDRTVDFATHNPEALMLYAKALEANDAASAEQGMAAAIAADPDFTPPYQDLARLKAQHGDRAGAQDTVARALATKKVSGMERARLEVEAAEIAGDGAALLASLDKLAKLDPGDIPVLRTLGDLSLQRHQYSSAMRAYQKAAGVAPDDPDIQNTLGYAAAQAGDFDAAVAALKRYRTLRPTDPNALDSMGDIHVIAGRFTEAEQFYRDAHKQNPAFLNDGDLIKAAMARLLAGDAAAATQVAGDYFAARKQKNDPALDYRRAHWDWVVGRRHEAIREMEGFAAAVEKVPALRQGAAAAWGDLAFWNLLLGNREAALALARKSGLRRMLALADPSQYPEALNGSIAQAYPDLLNRRFDRALEVLRRMWENGAPPDGEGLPVLLAWCYLETGKTEEAAALLRSNPTPPNAGPNVATEFYFPRIFYLRGLLAQKQGRQEEARTQFRKFVDLSGPAPLFWGEEARARAAL